jgi:hypothetical protein
MYLSLSLVSYLEELQCSVSKSNPSGVLSVDTVLILSGILCTVLIGGKVH